MVFGIGMRLKNVHNFFGRDVHPKQKPQNERQQTAFQFHRMNKDTILNKKKGNPTGFPFIHFSKMITLTELQLISTKLHP